jgi:hypothetical protein
LAVPFFIDNYYNQQYIYCILQLNFAPAVAGRQRRVQMKKERIAALCISAVLLGTLYTQWIVWTCHFAMPPGARFPWSAAARFSPPRHSAAEYVCAAWPPLGAAYVEAQILKQRFAEMQARSAKPKDFQQLAMRNARSGE